MIPNKVTTAVILDTRRPKKDGTFPVKLRVTYMRKQKYYALKMSFTESDFAKIQTPKPKGKFKEYQLILHEIEMRTREVIGMLPQFSFVGFEKRFLSAKGKWNDVFAAFDRRMEELVKRGQNRNYGIYNNAKKSVQRFTGQTNLRFEEITPDLLRDYEQWMLEIGNSISTVGFYLRPLRALFNIAIEEEIIPHKAYPFGKRKYQIPASRNIKKALKLSEVEKLYKYEAEEGSREQYMRDLWIFIYLCNGINVKDMVHLRYENISDNSIHFLRKKTQQTSRKNLKPVVVPLTTELKTIIERWGKKRINDKTFVFDTMEDGLTVEAEDRIIDRVIANINKHINIVAQEVGIEKRITTYTARHTFSTVLMRSGAPIAFISESLGHSNIKTTQRYLDSFGDDVKHKFAAKLMDFGGND